MARVNIIIRAFNRLEYTVLTIREINRLAGYDDYKMIVVDQASTDGTGQWLKSLVNEGYLKHKEQLPEDDYVFNKYALTGNDKMQTDFINKYFNAFGL